MTDRAPRPEPQWLYRRIYTWSLTAAALILIAVAVALAPRADLQSIALALIVLIALLATLYLIAPSAPELAAIFRELRTRVSFDRRPPPPTPPEEPR